MSHVQTSPTQSTFLWTAAEIEDPAQHARRMPPLPAWAGIAYEHLRCRITDKRFPCFYARLAHEQGVLCFAFAETTTEASDLRAIDAALREYLDRVRGRDDLSNAMTVLILFIKPSPHPLTLQEYHRQSWQLLQALHDQDPFLWPPEVPTEPQDHRWSFCFAGVSLFVNFSNPAHQLRQSRNLGNSLTLVIQPRNAFDLIAGDNPKGQKVREIIRRRVAAYDAIPPAPELATYGDPNAYEWKQYGLTEDNSDDPQRCPFRFRPPAHEHPAHECAQ